MIKKQDTNIITTEDQNFKAGFMLSEMEEISILFSIAVSMYKDKQSTRDENKD
tara:strand:+ start:146 stop:304 length:159 start_codon:yes stop_codon:yes gene_type:complete